MKKVMSHVTVLSVLCVVFSVSLRADQYETQRSAFRALGKMTAAPAMMDAPGYAPEGKVKAVFFDGLPWKGKPTKVFAWLGLPENRTGKVPGVVLVHGGGGTAFKNWVESWNARGYAAISIAVEGQTDKKDPASDRGTISTGWNKHAWSGPWRKGIYHDSAEPLQDQWMYHAVADTILANSLLRSLPEVDANKVGLMGISWGGVITSTVVGLDHRFAFAIPVYGCGHLFDAENAYGRSLGNNELYKRVLDPMVHLGKARMPILWFSWPKDSHFPLDCQAASYGAAGGPQMVSLVPGMGHGHGSGWNRPESYAFADAVVETGRPWCRQTNGGASGDTCRVRFESDKPFDRAVLVSTVDHGITGMRNWVETTADLSREGKAWVATAALPPGTTGWFVNLHSGELVASSGYTETALGTAKPATTAVQTAAPATRSVKTPDQLGRERMFGNMDVDQNGRVTRKEYTDVFKNNFNWQDKDGDGVLDEGEFNHVAFDNFDANDDGKVDPDEAHAMRLQHFQSLDEDGDGSLTLSEMLGR